MLNVAVRQAKFGGTYYVQDSVQLIFCFRNEIISYTQSGIKAARTDAAEVRLGHLLWQLHVTAHLLINFSFPKDRTHSEPKVLKFL